MGGRDGLTLRALRRLHSVLHCLLGFDGEVVEVHIFMLFIVVRKWSGSVSMPRSNGANECR